MEEPESRIAMEDSDLVRRCREEGERAYADGLKASSCPYLLSQSLERAGWLDGWGRAVIRMAARPLATRKQAHRGAGAGSRGPSASRH